METIRTLSCKLVVPPQVATRLEATLEAFAQACNFVADWGNEHKKHRQYDLHKGCYREVRKQFGLSANLAVALHIQDLCRLLACGYASSRRFLLQKLWASVPCRLQRGKEHCPLGPRCNPRRILPTLLCATKRRKSRRVKLTALAVSEIT